MVRVDSALRYRKLKIHDMTPSASSSARVQYTRRAEDGRGVGCGAWGVERPRALLAGASPIVF